MDGNGHSAAEKNPERRKRNLPTRTGEIQYLPEQTDERAKRMEWKDCEISYDPSTHMYRISNTGQSRILLLKDEQIVGIVEPNARVRIERPVMLQVKETKESLQLK